VLTAAGYISESLQIPMRILLALHEEPEIASSCKAVIPQSDEIIIKIAQRIIKITLRMIMMDQVIVNSGQIFINSGKIFP
jgi:hypothetical protein